MGPNGFPDHGGDDGVLAMGWGSGTANFTYLISPLEAIQARARKDRTTVSWYLNNWNLAGASSMVPGFEAAVRSLSYFLHYRRLLHVYKIVFVNADSGEGYITVDGNEGDRYAHAQRPVSSDY